MVLPGLPAEPVPTPWCEVELESSTMYFRVPAPDSFLNNSPLHNQFFVGPGSLAPGTLGNIQSQASGANSAFVTGFANGGTFNSISLANPFFVAAQHVQFRRVRSMHPNFRSGTSKYSKA